MFATAVAAAGSRSPASTSRASTSTPFTRAFSRVASIAGSSMSTPTTGANPSSAAAIESTPEPQPTSSSEPGSTSWRNCRQSCVVACEPVPKARPGSTTTASASGGRRLPRRPDPERAHSDRLMERAPPVLPAGLDVVAARTAEEVPEALLAARVGVGGELDPLRAVDLLEALGEELEHGRARLLEPLRADLDGDSAQAAQRNALFSLSKKPSSWR